MWVVGAGLALSLRREPPWLRWTLPACQCHWSRISSTQIGAMKTEAARQALAVKEEPGQGAGASDQARWLEPHQHRCVPTCARFAACYLKAGYRITSQTRRPAGAGSAPARPAACSSGQPSMGYRDRRPLLLWLQQRLLLPHALLQRVGWKCHWHWQRQPLHGRQCWRRPKQQEGRGRPALRGCRRTTRRPIPMPVRSAGTEGSRGSRSDQRLTAQAQGQNQRLPSRSPSCQH